MADLVYIYIGTAERQMLIYPAWQADANFDPRVRPGISWPASTWARWSGPSLLRLHQRQPGDRLGAGLTDRDGKVRGVFAMDAILAPFPPS